MTNRIPMRNALKPWLAELHFYREMFGGPEGKPLYSYKVTVAELDELKDLLAAHKESASHPIYGHFWSAGYCLFVAERYRRNYDGGTGGWSWSIFDEELGCEFTPNEKSQIVDKGLVGYWKRSIRESDKGRDFLGSLFLEGGLPWLLVQSDSHGFGRAVRRGLKHVYSAHSSQSTVSDILAIHEDELPKTFQNFQTRQLLAGIVEQLVQLANNPELESQEDPAAYLDKSDSDWRKDFPIPLDETNGRTLINDWLSLAGRQRKNQIQETERSKWFSCEHLLNGYNEDWFLLAEIVFPKQEIFPVDRNNISSTRLQICLYEDDKLLVMAGTVYGEIQDEGIKVRFPKTKLSVRRKNPESTIIFKLLSNGQPVIVKPIADSELDLNSAPLIFAKTDEEYTLAGNESCQLTNTNARIRLPAGAEYVGDSITELFTETCGGLWIEATSTTKIKVASDDYLITLGGDKESGSKLYIDGRYSGLSNCLPRTAYLGWPNLKVPTNSNYKNESISQYINAKPISEWNSNIFVGTANFRARDQSGVVVLKRTFGVLPPDFSMSLFPGYQQEPARLILRTQLNLVVSIENDEIRTEQVAHVDGIQINLHYTSIEVPKSFILKLSSVENTDPISFRIPFPNTSAVLADETETLVRSRDLIVDEMLGKRIVLCSGKRGLQRFNIRLRLRGTVIPEPVKDISIIIGEMPVELNLYNYRQDVEQMLAATADQDAFVQVEISSVAQLLKFNIRRYNGVLKLDGNDRYFVSRLSPSKKIDRVVAEAMLLSDPSRAPQTLPALKSEGVLTGQFEIPPLMEKFSPWIVYPSGQSTVQFRPGLFLGSEAAAPNNQNVNSLHQACQLYNPFKNPEAINQQIHLMAKDLNHSGWQYLSDLMQKYSHLPMSTFQAWIALAKNTEALGVAVYRLELDELFCSRIRDELSTLWECVTLDTWQQAHKIYESWVNEQALPQALATSVLNSRMEVLANVVPGFREFGDYIRTGEIEKLPQIPPLDFILPDWYQVLRRHHESDDDWPNDLNRELTRWINSQDLPEVVRNLSGIHYSHSVVYLPIFMAHVTVGQCTISDLHSSEPYLKHTIRHLSEYDRLNWYNCIHGVMVTYLLKNSVE